MRPLPRPDAMSAPYWEAAARGVLLVPECRSCHRRHAPPEGRCPYCRSDWSWATSPGTGTVYTYTVVDRPVSADFPAPYVLAVVELDDGWMSTTNIVECDPQAVTCGMPVEVTFEKHSDEMAIPLFRPLSHA
jgi:uncharacterized OB-fold protein